MLTHVTLFQPSAIDNALSTMQIIHKIINNMNIIIDEVNSIDSKANEYTDEQLSILRSELTVKFDEIELLINSLSGRIDTNVINIQDLYSRLYDLRQLLDNNTNFLNGKINDVELSLTNQIQNAYTTLWHYIDSKVDILETLIESLTETKVFGLNGKLTSIQQAIDDLKNALNFEFNFISFKNLTTNILTSTYHIDTDVTLGDITYADLLAGIRNNTQGGAQIATMYPSFILSNTPENHTFVTNFFYAVRQPFIFTFLSLVLATSAHTGTGYYNYYGGVSILLTMKGVGYGKTIYNKSSVYGNYN